jgi:hypothetical protein
MAAAAVRFAWARALAAIDQIHATLAAPPTAVMQDRPDLREWRRVMARRPTYPSAKLTLHTSHRCTDR